MWNRGIKHVLKNDILIWNSITVEIIKKRPAQVIFRWYMFNMDEIIFVFIYYYHMSQLLWFTEIKCICRYIITIDFLSCFSFCAIHSILVMFTCICKCCLMLRFFTSHATIFQLCRDRSAWFEPVLSNELSCSCTQRSDTLPLRLEPTTSRSWDKHSTTEPLRSQICKCFIDTIFILPLYQLSHPHKYSHYLLY